QPAPFWDSLPDSCRDSFLADQRFVLFPFALVRHAAPGLRANDGQHLLIRARLEILGQAIAFEFSLNPHARRPAPRWWPHAPLPGPAYPRLRLRPRLPHQPRPSVRRKTRGTT